MAQYLRLEPNKTYASPANAIKAVEKKVKPEDLINLRFIVYPELTEQNIPTGRYFPVFIGAQALHASMHFHFHVVA